MPVKELLDYIQENLNNGRLTPESKVRIRDNWGDDYPINCIRAENNELILADFGIQWRYFMKIPKEAQDLLDKRERLAMDLMSVTSELDTQLVNNGADLTDTDLIDSTLTGCMIYCEPRNARNNVEEYIKNRM